jgi:hypothetical protein
MFGKRATWTISTEHDTFLAETIIEGNEYLTLGGVLCGAPGLHFIIAGPNGIDDGLEVISALSRGFIVCAALPSTP